MTPKNGYADWEVTQNLARAMTDLQKRGFQTTIYTRTVPPDTTL